MNTKARSLQRFCWFALIISASSLAQQSQKSQATLNCQRFTQEFFDWYTPFTQNDSDGPALDIAIKDKAGVFSPELLRALRGDAEAQARTPGEIVGIDFDPFVGSQDPADHYAVRHVSVKGNTCSAEVWRDSPSDTRTPKPQIPDSIAELVEQAGRWKFVNFRYPDFKTDLLRVLASLRKERQKT